MVRNTGLQLQSLMEPSLLAQRPAAVSHVLKPGPLLGAVLGNKTALLPSRNLATGLQRKIVETQKHNYTCSRRAWSGLMDRNLLREW